MRERIQRILTNLDAVGEDLLALSDDIWLDIDHNDSDAVMKGAEFKVNFNREAEEFRTVTARLAKLIEDFTAIPAFDLPVAPASSKDRKRRENNIQALDRGTPLGLGKDFRYKRPAGFTLSGTPFDGTHTWSQVYETLCRHLALLNPLVFDGLATNANFLSSKGNRYFSRNKKDLRTPRDFGRGVLAETNLSANQIRDNINRLLNTFGLPASSFVAYLREDRDAG